MLTKERKTLSLDHCDVIKVFMMISVMFYHCICLWSGTGWFNQPPAESSRILAFIAQWFNSFHIYVFTFVSGYLFYFLKYEKERYKSFVKDTVDRAKRLLIPYVVTSVFWVIPFYAFFFDTSVKNVVWKFVFATSPNQLWFLVMIFVVFVLFYLVSDLFLKCNFFLGFVISVGIYIVATIGAVLVPNVFQIWTAGKYIFFYYMGFAFRRYKDNVFYKVPWICYLVSHVALLAFGFFYLPEKSGIVSKLASIAISPVTSTVGMLMVVIGLSKFKYERLKNCTVFKLLSKHNFFMYLVHQQIIYCVISLLNGRVLTPILVLSNFAISLSVSLLMGVLISRIPVVKRAVGYK